MVAQGTKEFYVERDVLDEPCLDTRARKRTHSNKPPLRQRLKDSMRMNAPVVPDLSLFPDLIGDAFAIAVIGYAIVISLGKTFGLKHGYKVDSNQELVALGVSNSVGGFFQCYAVTSSMSRSMVQESTGGKTQVRHTQTHTLLHYIYMYSFSRRFYSKRLPRESFTKVHRSMIINKQATII
ncbi:sulfate transporter-like [Osmerus eperlanus]|uniref:sulfate transporter-like n=1 Tax=Osmerus eperlanus TaxID=29151 RepID=UPI002E109EBE